MDELTERFWNMAKLLDEASVLLDAQSKVVAANDAALDILGSHITGYPLDRFLRHPDFADAVRRASYEGALTSLDYTRMDQVRRSFTLRIAPFEPGYVLLVIFDGTMGLSVERIRSDFVANVSHELRSPLTALSGFIETLQDGAVEDEAARMNFLSIMQGEAARLQRQSLRESRRRSLQQEMSRKSLIMAEARAIGRIAAAGVQKNKEKDLLDKLKD